MFYLKLNLLLFLKIRLLTYTFTHGDGYDDSETRYGLPVLRVHIFQHSAAALYYRSWPTLNDPYMQIFGQV